MSLKRKIEKELKNSGNCPRASKVKIIESKKKALTKNELMIEFKALEEKYKTLDKENKTNLQEIARHPHLPGGGRDQELAPHPRR